MSLLDIEEKRRYPLRVAMFEPGIEVASLRPLKPSAKNDNHEDGWQDKNASDLSILLNSFHGACKGACGVCIFPMCTLCTENFCLLCPFFTDQGIPTDLG